MRDSEPHDPRDHEVLQLHRALENSRTIGKAIGILMERYKIDDAKAFETLSRVSQQEQTKLSVVADRLVRTGLLATQGHSPAPDPLKG